jgi:hypothetical protein
VCSTWSSSASYDAGDVIVHQGKNYTAKVQHTLAAGVSWTPDATAQLWTEGGTCKGALSAKTPLFTPPPASWKEHWAEHVQDLRLIAYNDTVALYFDADMTVDNGKWMIPYLTSMWQYVQKTYGGINNNKLTADRLYSIHHQNKYSGGHPSTVYDGSHDNRNVSDVGSNGDWSKPVSNYEVVTHESGHVVEGVATGFHGSPAFPLWKDSKWMEFYIYDVYVNLGMADAAKKFYDRMVADSHTDSYPWAGTHWFRDWFYPLWRDHGGAKVMADYFKLLGDNFPKKSNGVDFARDLNWGEFVHFMSAAAGADLRDMAGKAFGGWVWQAAFDKARTDFPGLNSRYTLGATPETPPPAAGAVPSIGTCVDSTGNMVYVKVYESAKTRWCISPDYYARRPDAVNQKFFDYGEQVVSTLQTLYSLDLDEVLSASDRARGPFTFQVESPNGGASTGTNFAARGVKVTGDAFYNVYTFKDDANVSHDVPGFWGYLLTLHESINVWSGAFSQGWPTDWWADHRSPFPNSMDYRIMNTIGAAQSNPVLLDAAQAQHLRMGVAGKSGYDPEVGMFDGFYDTYGGYPAFARAFKLVKDDGMKWDKLGANPSVLRTEYVIAYLQLGFGTATDLTKSKFVASSIGKLDTSVPDYSASIDPQAVKGIADAHCSIAGARGDTAVSAATLNAALTSLRGGNYAGASIDGQQACTLTAADKRPSECTCASNGKWVAPWAAAL